MRAVRYVDTYSRAYGELYIYNVYIHIERQAVVYIYIYIYIICVCIGLLISGFHYIQREY